VATLSARVPGAVHVVGWSLGALVAMAWAAGDAHRVASLVLISGTPSFAARPDWTHGWATDVLDDFSDGLAADPSATLARFTGLVTLGAPGARAAAASLRGLLDQAPAPQPQALRAAFAALRATDLRPRLDAVRAPVLALHGHGDRIVPVAAGERLAAALPDARFEAIEAAAHAPLLSHADWVVRRIEAFHERG